jgi:predicted nuclease of restriction endonuclease-like RecB superfamily
MYPFSYIRLGITIVASILVATSITASVSFLIDRELARQALADFQAQAKIQVRAAQASAQAAIAKQAEVLAKQSEVLAKQRVRMKADALAQERDRQDRMNARKTNLEICSFWEAEYLKTRSSEATLHRRDACKRIGKNY